MDFLFFCNIFFELQDVPEHFVSLPIDDYVRQLSALMIARDVSASRAACAFAALQSVVRAVTEHRVLPDMQHEVRDPCKNPDNFDKSKTDPVTCLIQ